MMEVTMLQAGDGQRIDHQRRLLFAGEIEIEARTMVATVVTAKVSNRSAAMPAQSPTLSPTLSAMVARVARIVFGNARFDLAHHVAADIGALGEDAAAQTGEDGDQRRAEAQADQTSP